MMLSIMLMRLLLIKGDDLCDCRECGCFSEKDQLCKMIWAKRPLKHNTPASAIIRIHLATETTVNRVRFVLLAVLAFVPPQ